MTSPREGAARPEEIAREILRYQRDYERQIGGIGESFWKGQISKLYPHTCPDLARAYLDLLAERERTRATLETMPAPQGFDAESVLEIVDSWEKNGIARAALERLSGPSHEGRSA